MLSAVHLYRQKVFEAGWTAMPDKTLSDDVFDAKVRVGEIRTRTLDFQTVARRALDCIDVFEGKLSAICVSAQIATSPRAFPIR
jgi:hypothetical protein